VPTSAAARYDDIIKHSSALLGFFAGAVAGVVIALVVGATGGLALAAVVAIGGALGGAAGAGAGVLVDSFLDTPGITTGKLQEGSTTILINGRRAIAILDASFCYVPIVYNHGMKHVVEGSETVFFHCRPASRKGDALLCDGKISSGSPNVLIGGPTVRVKGTKRSWFDDVLDYASLYFTALSLSTPAGVIALFVGEGVSYGLHMLQASTLENAAAVQTVNLGKEGLVEAGKMQTANLAIEAANRQAERIALEELAQKTAAVENALYTKYALKKIAANETVQSRAYWLSRYFVQQSLMKNAPKFVPPKLVPPKAFNWKGFAKNAGPGLLVDIVRVGREIGREMEVPNKFAVHCDDTSWLEPA